MGFVRPTRAAAAPRGAAIPRASAAIAGEFKIKRGTNEAGVEDACYALSPDIIAASPPSPPATPAPPAPPPSPPCVPITVNTKTKGLWGNEDQWVIDNALTPSDYGSMASYSSYTQVRVFARPLCAAY